MTIDGQDNQGVLGSGRPASLGEAWQLFPKLMRRSMGSLLIVWGALYVLSVLMGLPNTLLDLVTKGLIDLGLSSDEMLSFQLMVIPFSLASAIGGFILTGLSAGMYRPMRQLAFGDKESIGGALDVLRSASLRMGTLLLTFILTLAAVCLGFVMCIIPGLVLAVVLSMAPYLAATRDELSAIDAMKQSARLVSENLWTILLAGLLVVVLSLPIYAGVGLLILPAVMFIGQMVLLVVLPVTWFVGFMVGYVMWIFLGSVYITIETADSGVEVQRLN